MIELRVIVLLCNIFSLVLLKRYGGLLPLSSILEENASRPYTRK
jgi:hypothetical protein